MQETLNKYYWSKYQGKSIVYLTLNSIAIHRNGNRKCGLALPSLFVNLKSNVSCLHFTRTIICIRKITPQVQPMILIIPLQCRSVYQCIAGEVIVLSQYNAGQYISVQQRGDIIIPIQCRSVYQCIAGEVIVLSQYNAGQYKYRHVVSITNWIVRRTNSFMLFLVFSLFLFIWIVAVIVSISRNRNFPFLFTKPFIFLVSFLMLQ